MEQKSNKNSQEPVPILYVNLLHNLPRDIQNVGLSRCAGAHAALLNRKTLC